VTDSDGLVDFEFSNFTCEVEDDAVSLDDEDEDCTKTVTITETLKSGYVIEQQGAKNAVCTESEDDEVDDESDDAVPVTNTTNGVSLTLERGDDVTCVFKNTPLPSSIQILKATTNGVGGPFEFNVSGPNGTDEDLSGTTSQGDNPTDVGTVSSLYPGEYTVLETDLPEGTTLDDVDCGEAKWDTTEDGAVVSLGPDEDVVCTFTNDTPFDLSILKTSSGDPAAGATTITYTLKVTNLGPGENEDPITVTDTLPAGLSYNSATGTGWVCNNVANAITCTHDDQLAVGANSTITVVANINPATITASTQNCATVTDTTTEDTNDTSCVTNNTTAVMTAGAGTLAFTGSKSIGLTAIAASLLVVGLAALGLSRRRRTAEEIG
jgi:uncharacterized repeat protein (TIGR01451 family)